MATKTTSKKTSAKKTTRSTGTRSSAKSSAKTTSSRSTTGRKTSAGRAKLDRSDRAVLRRAKGSGWLAILESIVIGVLGGLLIADPTGVTKMIFYVVGFFLIIKGVYKVINFFLVHGKYDFYNNDLLYGIIALVFGVIAVVLWEPLGKIISIIVGAWMIYGALVRINTAIKMRAAGVREWFYVLLLALVMMALGIYMVVSIGAALTIVGWVMIAAAVVGIIEDVFFIRNIDAVAR